MWQPNEDLRRSALGLIEGEMNLVANLANLAAVIYHTLTDLNWAGFYLWDKNHQELVLGPFQGKPACLRIKSGRGVCGTAFAQLKTQLVDDVHAFPGHIACDSASRSELVIPLIWEGQCVGVLDLDSPKLARFSQQEAAMLESLMSECITKIWPGRELL
jgi:GAF domain-containing protein